MFGTWQSRAEAWMTVQVGVDAGTVVSAKGRSMNPMRGVQPRDVAFGPRLTGWTARTGMSLKWRRFWVSIR